MSTVAEQLRRGREARNLTIQQVAEITKFRSDHIGAVEDGNFDVFSAPVYIRGFVRTYATLLKLDVPAVLAELDSELAQNGRLADPPPLSEEQGGFVDSLMLKLSRMGWRKGAAGFGVMALLVILIAAFFTRKEERPQDPLAGVKPPLYQSTQTVSGDVLPLPRSP